MVIFIDAVVSLICGASVILRTILACLLFNIADINSEIVTCILFSVPFNFLADWKVHKFFNIFVPKAVKLHLQIICSNFCFNSVLTHLCQK